MDLVCVEDQSIYLTVGDTYKPQDGRSNYQYEYLIECDDGRMRWYPADWFEIK